MRHAIVEAKRLDMQVALTLSPGWSFGGPRVPVRDRSKVLAPAWIDFTGPKRFDGELPAFKLPVGRVRGPEGRIGKHRMPIWWRRVSIARVSTARR